MFPLQHRLVLGSASPRRQNLLSSLGFSFEVRVQNSEENFPEEMPKEKVPVFLAGKKRDALLPTLNPKELLITTDTVVILQNEIIGKAENYDEAFEMLSKLSGNKHEVVSGVCLTSFEKQVSFSEKTSVFFKKLSSEEIHYYIATYKPFDKAGSYGIQEWLGMIGIVRIEGCFYNVMGLPVSRLYEALRNF